MLQAIKEQALRLDTSLSNIVQKSWTMSRSKVTESDYDRLSTLLKEFVGNKKDKQTLFFPGDMLAEIRDQATRLDCSLSFVMQSAWVMVRDAIAILPVPKDS